VSRRFGRVWRGATFAVFCVFLAAKPLLAQASGASPADSATGWRFRWLNFAIVLGAIIYFFVKRAAPYFRRHSEEIARQIAEGTRAREAAEKQRREVREKLAGIEREIAEMAAEAKRGAEAEAERLHALMRKDAEAIERAAEEEIAAAGRAAAMKWKALAAELAIARAEDTLRRELTPQAEAALFQTFVAELERSAN